MCRSRSSTNYDVAASTVLRQSKTTTRKEMMMRLLERARTLVRIVFTLDVRFKASAEEWQRQGRPFAGLLFGHQLGGTIGQYVKDLELVAKASEPSEWLNMVEHIPF
jgi:hypothetical protein